MLATTIAGLGLLLMAAGPGDPPGLDDAAAYRAAADAAVRDPEAHVRLALWCEARGLADERLQHLAQAVLADPEHAAARGLLGHIKDSDGRWRRPEAAIERAAADPAMRETLAEYADRRASARDTAESQWELALWCESAGLAGQARAHLTNVVRLDPSRESAWKRLGCKKIEGRWMSEAQALAARAEKAEQQAADRRWKAALEKWKVQLGDSRKREATEQSLNAIQDPRAVPAVWAVFVASRNPNLPLATQLLGQIDAREASRALTMLAVMADSEDVRRRATETLRGRDPREFADLLIDLIRSPIRYEVRPASGPGSIGELFIEGERVNRRRLYVTPPTPTVQPGDQIVGYDEFGLPIIGRFTGPIFEGATINVEATLKALKSMRSAETFATAQARFDRVVAGNGLDPRLRDSAIQLMILSSIDPNLASLELMAQALPNVNSGTNLALIYRNQQQIPIRQMQAEAMRAAENSSKQLENDVAWIEAQNEPIRLLNDRAVGILQDVTGLALGDKRESWTSWYVDQLGYRQERRDATQPITLTERVTPAFVPAPVAMVEIPISARRMSCFGAGTPVHTLEGLRPIEDVKVGDLVLSQDTRTGRLNYQPVLAVHHNPPGATFDVDLGDETVTASVFHRFWRAGRGWAMARDLTAGDRLRTLGGTSEVARLSEGREQPVYNLDVAGGRTFFVGRAGVLVHDNSVPDLRAEPFDRVEIVAATPSER